MYKRLFWVLLLFSNAVFAQTPVTDPIADDSGFPGSGSCFQATLTNTGATGYGPYLQVIMPAEISLDSASLFGGGVAVTVVGSFPPAPGNQLTDPVTGNQVTGNEGDVLYILHPPVGSVVTGGLPLDIEICYTIDPMATVNVPLGVQVIPVYEFGDTPTGDNGPITGTAVNFNITPTLVEFEKINNAPEGERPPGDDWPVTYTVTARVAPNNSIDNLLINDILPAGYVVDVPGISVSAGCVLNTTNPINVSCPTVNGTGGNDVVITYSGYFDDILDETTCSAQLLTNNATLDGDFMANPIPQVLADSDVNVEHLSIQKSASTAAVSPGETVTFTLNVQLSEFASSDALVITDTMDDGFSYVGGSASSSLGPITPGVNVVAGVTTLTFDLIAANGGTLTGGAPAVTISYQATVNQAYDNGDPILASDVLNNIITSNHNLTAGATGCSETSSNSTTIRPVSITKDVVNPQAFYEPGDSITYRLTMQIPSGDTNGIIFTDYLPLPVLDATTVSTTFGVDVVLSPDDTLGLTPLNITTDAGTNSVAISWPNITTLSTQTLSVDLTAIITTDPFADNLNLSNILAVQSENSDTTIVTNVTPINIQVRAPDLNITKGVLSADQGIITPPPATLPVDGDLDGADAADAVAFLITVENTGGAQAFDVVITDPAVPGLDGCTVTSVTDGTGTPIPTTGNITTGLSLSNPLAGNDGTPGAPFSNDTALVTINCNLAPATEFDTELINTASVVYSGAPGAATYPSQSDEATITSASPDILKTVVSVTPDVDGVNNTITVGEIIRYQVVVTLPEGVATNARIIDRLDNGLLINSVVSLTASAGANTSVVGGFAAVQAGATGIGSRDLVLDFQTLTSSTTGETLTLVYDVLVNDAAAITDGTNRNNRVDFVSTNITQGEVRDNAPNRRVREPNLVISKSASPMIGDAGDTITYTITVTNTGRSPAFDVNLEDLLSDPNLTLVDGSVSTSAGVVTTGNGVGDTTIAINIPSINRTGQAGDVLTVSFDALIGAGVTAGTNINNTASVTQYSSLPGGGRIYPQVNGSTVVSVATATAVKTVLGNTSTEQSLGISGQGDGSLVDLTIGETVTFEIVATLAEGVSPSVMIIDTLPDSAAGQMQLVSAAVISEGVNLTVTNSFPTPAVGPANVVAFDFGQVTNTADGVVNDADRIVVQVVAQVTENSANTGIESLRNTALVQFNGGVDATVTADVEVVEPIMTINKTSLVSSGDAGDTFNVQLSVDNLMINGSSANAFDVVISDALPAEWVFAGNLQTDSGLAPDSLSESGGIITANWAIYPLNQQTVISFDVTLANSVTPGQVSQNTASVTWDSMPGAVAEQRIGSDNDGHAITIGAPGLVKQVINTSEAGTSNGVNGPEPDLTIGELVTYQFTVTLPEGTTPLATVADQLPTNGVVFDVISSQIVFVGGQITLGMGAVGTPGATSDTNADTYDDLISWNLGNVLNSPDGANNPDDQITFEVVAVVVDEAINQTGTNDVVNNARFDFDGGTLQATALVDLVEPLLSVEKTTVPAVIIGDAGDVLNYQLTITHQSGSTADAYNVEVTDLLPVPGTVWINDSTVVSTCPGLITDSSAEPTIVYTVPTLALISGSCTIDYQVQVDNAVTPNNSYQNLATLQYDSTPVFVAGQTRRGSDADDAVFATSVPAMIKTTTTTSLADTGTDEGDPLLPDLAIGELVDYDITITLPEGTIDNAIIQDNLPVAPSGSLMEVVSAAVTRFGANVTATLPGTPLITDSDVDTIDDQVVFDFGTITNLPDGMVDANDQISVRVTARLLDNPLNVDGDVAINNASFDFNGSTGPLLSSADIDVVEPNLSFSKQMGPLVNGRVPITLILSNTGGHAPAFDILITDVLDGAVWDLSSIAADSIPSGFIFSLVPGAGQTTVQLSSDPSGSSPDNSIEPNEQVVFVFSALLRDDVVLPNPVNNTATVSEVNSLPGIDSNERDYSDLSDSASLGFSELDSTKADSLLIDGNSNGQVNPGDTIRYTIVINNTGAGDATAVTFTDTPDANTTLVVGSVTTSLGSVIIGNTAGDSTVSVDIGTLVASGSVTVTFDVVINNPFPVGVNEVVNQGVVDSDEFPEGDTDDPDTGNVDDPTVTPVVAEHDLSISKDDGGITAAAGDTIVYAINYANLGDQNSTGVTITETVPDNTLYNPGANPDPWVCVPGNMAGSTCTLTIGNLDGGQSGSVVFAVDVFNPKPSGVTQILNTVSIADDGLNGTETNTANNVDDETTPVDAAPDLTLTKTDAVSVVAPGDVIVYTLSFANIGTQDATGVVITESVPDHTNFEASGSTPGWSCADGSVATTVCLFNIGDLNAGDPAGQINYAVRVVSPLPGGVDQVINAASISDDGSNGPDTNPGNNADNETTPVGALPDLYINKTDNDVTSGPGGLVTYVLDYGNIGTQNATGVVITETVPDHSTFSPADSTAGWNCLPDNSAGSTCQFNVGPLNVGDTGMVNFAVLVDDPLAPGVNELFNVTSITDDGTNGVDPDPGNNNSTDTTGLLLEPPVGIKTGVFDANNNSVIHWTFYWFNPNNNRDLPVFVFDPIPDRTAYIPGSASCVADGSSTCTTPVFNASLNQLELTGVIAPDFGAPVDASDVDLNNEIVIQFSTRITAGGEVQIENQAFANWDEDNDGDATNDANDGQTPIPTDAPLTPVYGDPTVLGAVFAVPFLMPWALLLLLGLFLLLASRYRGHFSVIKQRQ